ncbi:MAG: hypothetical protein K0S32_233 [Bacteroidetes bacterium]|jgi:hypothetical protein|nr:hypothetical protein [Bacteroidota bacterium]
MKKTYFLLYIIAVIFSSCGSKIKPDKTSLQQEGLRGKVKKITQIEKTASYELVNGDTTFIFQNYFSDDSFILSYDEKGNSTERISFNSDGTVDEKYIYKFNTEGRLTEIIITDSLDKPKDKCTWKYDSEGNAVEKNMFMNDEHKNQRLIADYDDNFNVTEQKLYSHSNELCFVYRFEYNEKGYKTQWQVLDPEDMGIFQCNKYSYDDKGNLITEDIYEFGDELKSKKIFNYDSKNNLTREQNKHATKKTFDEDLVYKYEFDSIGNWIKKTIYKNGSLSSVIEREFEYYK